VILRLQGNFSFTEINAYDTGTVISVIILFSIWVAMLIAMFALTYVHIIQRFINNFMRAQGAIMFTLPVTVWKLLAAKVIAAFCVLSLSWITVAVSIFAFTEGLREAVSSFIGQIMIMPSFNFGTIMIMVFAYCASFLQAVLLICIAITVSYLLPRFRFAAACGIFIIVRTFMEMPLSKFVSENTKLNFKFTLESAFDNEMYTSWINSMIPMGIVSLAFAALYFWLTGFLLKRTYNLE
jgi:hypothetical protein